MSREIPTDQALSDEDRAYLEQRGNYALIRKLDDEFGGASQPEPESEEGLTQQIADLEAQLNDLRGRQTQLRIAREQEEARVRDNTVVDGEGGSENRADEYDDWTKQRLSEEITRRNEERDEEDRLSPSGTKAQLIDRLRADDADYPDGYAAEDEDDDEDEDDA